MIRNLFSLIFSLFFVLFASAQAQTKAPDFDPVEFEIFVESAMNKSGVPGLAVVLFDENGIYFEKAFGVADDQGRSATLDTPFQLGSVSKSFASLLIVQLAAEGKIDLDQPVINYLPNASDNGVQAWHDVTVRQLVGHRSGIPTLEGNRQQDNTYRGDDALEKALQSLNNFKLNSKPGTKFEYSNANYMIIAAVIEHATGHSFENVMSEWIFSPLNLADTYVQFPVTERTDEAIGFRQWFGRAKAKPYIAGRAMMAAGGVTASARDLATYVQAVAGQDKRIIPADFSDDLFEPVLGSSADKKGYGFGWMFNEVKGRKVMYHSGLNGGFASHAAFFPDEGKGGIVVTNLSGSLQADVAGGVLRRGLGVPVAVPRPSLIQHVIIWGLLATIIILAVLYVWSTRRFAKYVRDRESVNAMRRVLPALVLLLMTYVFWVVIPHFNGAELSGIRVFYPDIWLCLVLGGAICMLWAITRFIYPLWSISDRVENAAADQAGADSKPEDA